MLSLATSIRLEVGGGAWEKFGAAGTSNHQTPTPLVLLLIAFIGAYHNLNIIISTGLQLLIIVIPGLHPTQSTSW